MKKNKQHEGQQAGRRLRKAVDGPKIMKWYATTPTAELARGVFMAGTDGL